MRKKLSTRIAHCIEGDSVTIAGSSIPLFETAQSAFLVHTEVLQLERRSWRVWSPQCRTAVWVSNKIEVQNAITVCTTGDTTDSGSPTTQAPSTTGSNTDCAEVSDMVDLYTAAASRDACADDSSVFSSTVEPLHVVSSSRHFAGAHTSKLEELATTLPNCNYNTGGKMTKSV